MSGSETEVVAALAILIDFLFGITFGVMGGAIHGSRRGTLLTPESGGLLGAGARVFFGVYTRGQELDR